MLQKPPTRIPQSWTAVFTADAAGWYRWSGGSTLHDRQDQNPPLPASIAAALPDVATNADPPESLRAFAVDDNPARPRASRA